MSWDIDLLRELEKSLWITLREVSLEEAGLLPWKKDGEFNGYSLDEDGNITGLKIVNEPIGKALRLIVNFKLLQRLTLYRAALDDISPLEELPLLTHLHIGGNILFDIAILEKLPLLVSLDLSYNQISDLTPLTKLPRLVSLDLSSNRFQQIEVLKHLSQLRVLDLRYNKIVDFSPLAPLTRLTALDLRGNKIDDIEILKDLKNLTQLDLGSNRLLDLSVLQQLSALTQLDLSANQLRDISILLDLPNLTQLDLSTNQIHDLTALQHLPRLARLDLSHNRIVTINSLQYLKELKHLDLRHNKITQLPSFLFDMNLEIDIEREHQQEDKIYLTGNSIETPPLEIIKRGAGAARAYYQSLQTGQPIPLNEVKVLLVGEGGSGKTSLVKCLLNRDFDPDERQTDGINIDEWSFSISEQKIKANIWDFGGQEIMRTTHQFFLSKRSLYILVLDSRKEDKTEYWLRLIKSFGGDSPVLIALNKTDENPSFEVNRKFLLEKYPIIKGFHRLSCKNRNGVDDFTEALQNELSRVEMLHTTWPALWFHLKQDMEKLENHFISIEEYEAMCLRRGVTEKNLRDTLVEFLNDLGIVVHFRDFSLDDTYILEPKWVTEAVYKIINSPRLHDCRGVLKLDMLDAILKQRDKNDYIYPRDKQNYIIQLMRKFEICYQLDEQRVLIPDLLAVVEPHFDFDASSALKLVFRYEFMPKSIMPRFIVRRNCDIKDELQWRTGVVLHDPDLECVASVKADEQAGEIAILVNGPFPMKREYLSILRKELRDLNETFDSLNAVEWVPLPGHGGRGVPYIDLLGHEYSGRDFYFNGELRRDFSVRELLDGVADPEERKNDFHSMLPQGAPLYIDISPHFHQENIQKVAVRQTQETNVNVDVDIDIDIDVQLAKVFPDLKSEFFALKAELEKAGILDEEMEKELQKIEDALDELSNNPKKDEVVKPMNKMSRFLSRLADKKSPLNKFISGAQKGFELAQSLGRTYNKVAQWLVLPQIPTVLVGKDK